MFLMTEKIKKLLKKYNQGIKLDIGCGENKQPDFVGLDIQKLPGVDIIWDFEKFPFPLPDECCSTVMASHVVEHINPAKFGFVNWMNEIWRIMKPRGTLLIATPYAGSPGFWQDPTHINGVNEITFAYFDPTHSAGLYRFYKPKPWRIRDCVWNSVGNLEIILEKIKDEKK